MKIIRKYLYEILLANKRLCAEIYRRILDSCSAGRACKIKNITQSFKGMSSRFYFDRDLNLYFVQDEGNTHYFSEKMRGFDLYTRGLDKRAMQLAKSYYLDQIKFEKNDYFIDCGANYADIYLYLKTIPLDLNYLAFEPSPREFQCIKLNAPRQECNELALFENAGEFELYISSAGADSSLIEPKNGYDEKIQVSCTTLDDYLAQKDIPMVKLLKLEAEGLEPEILRGGIESLKNIAYISVDGGPERGLNEEQTISTVTNILCQNNFIMLEIDIKAAMGRVLYKNLKF